MEKEVTVDEAVNADGDVMGVITIDGRKTKYFVESECIRQQPTVVDELKKAIEQLSD